MNTLNENIANCLEDGAPIHYVTISIKAIDKRVLERIVTDVQCMPVDGYSHSVLTPKYRTDFKNRHSFYTNDYCGTGKYHCKAVTEEEATELGEYRWTDAEMANIATDRTNYKSEEQWAEDYKNAETYRNELLSNLYRKGWTFEEIHTVWTVFSVADLA